MACGDGFSLKDDAEFEEWRIEKLWIWGFRVWETFPPFKVLEAPLVLIPQF
jgi:hypothetical protein